MPESDSPLPWRPWRSAVAGWLVAGAALVVGVPLFLAMPPWCDVTLYQMAARNVLHGGVHYRDIFDTNLPGFVWLMAACQTAFGLNYEALRAVDLLVIGGAVAVLCGWVRRSGGSAASVAWFVAAAVLFYPFMSEFSHIQRDPWMLLPAALAARLRLRRVMRWELSLPSPLTGEGGESSSRVRGETLAPPRRNPSPVGEALTPSPARGEGTNTLSAVLEGFLWGAAVWLKPHVVVPAFVVWAVSAVFLARREPGRRIVADLAALVGGGLIAGAPGVAWLVRTGAWPHFLDVFLNWNPAYVADSGPLSERGGAVFSCLRPWSLINYLALPLAVLALWEGRVWSRAPGAPAKIPRPKRWYQPAESESIASARALLAALYLGWMAQVVFVQRALDYVHVPLLLLAFAVIASHRWGFGFAYLLWFVAIGAVVTIAEKRPDLAPAIRRFDPDSSFMRFEKYPLVNPEIVKLWPRACTEGGTPELRDRIGHYTGIHCGTRWGELNEVAGFLRTVEPPLGPGELNCWHDSTHPLYLILDLDPATRYMHYGTAFGIKETGQLPPGQKSKREQIADAVRTSRQRYVVSDFLRAAQEGYDVYEPRSWRAGDPLPVWFPANERQKFPWNQPIVFRSGRYAVHKIDPTKPLGTIRVPAWLAVEKLEALGPDE